MLPDETKTPVIEPEIGLTCPWSPQKAGEWFEKNGWRVGCNYIPATAINQLEMWQSETFDPFLIDRELSWAAALGFNTIRVFLHHLVWEQDPAVYLHRIDQFLNIANKQGIKTILVLFDSVWDPNPKSGKQPMPRPNIHNSGWVQCPGFDILNNTSRYDELFGYVNGIVSHFKRDDRVLLWDLFNEPDNTNTGSYKDEGYTELKASLSLQLLKKTMNWVRMIDPVQPVTMAPWQWVDLTCLSELDQYMFTHSDIISFHCYEDKAGMEKRILSLKEFGRPVICSEYMARPFDCTFQEILPLFRKYNIGACSWGLVQGKSQTHCPWDSWQISYENGPELWFHDIFHADGEPYDTNETTFLKSFLSKENAPLQKVA
jgi:hypothetical protein